MGDFNTCFSFTIGEEGGYTNNIHDPGGPTKYGITIHTLSAWRGFQCEAEDVEDMDLKEAKDIYFKNYWLPIRGDQLPQGIALCTFDAAVNSGVRQAVKWLQCSLKVYSDGLIGPVTIASAKKHAGDGELINDLLNIRLAFMKGLPTWSKFGRGWAHRLADLRCEAL